MVMKLTINKNGLLYCHIYLDELRQIELWRTTGMNVDAIAEQLDRHRSTIFPEITQHVHRQGRAKLTGCYCVTAHDMACERRAKLRKLARSSLFRRSDRTCHAWLVATTDRCPYAVAKKKLVHVSAETIGRVIYSQEDYELGLYLCLPAFACQSFPFDRGTEFVAFRTLEDGIDARPVIQARLGKKVRWKT